MAIDLRKRISFSIVIGLLFYVSVECVFFVSILVREFVRGPGQKEFLQLELSPEARSSIQKLLAGEAGKFGHNARLGWLQLKSEGRTINSQGIRSRHEYPLQPPDARLRIAVFGESYAFGGEVDDDDAWAARLDELQPKVEVLNFGVGSYGLDQAYLRYRLEGVRFRPDVVFICYQSDIAIRSVNVFRPFLFYSLPLSKPRFVLQDGELTLIENPLSELADYQDLLDDEASKLRELGGHDYIFQRAYHDSFSYHHLPSVRVLRLLSEKLFDHSGDLIHFGVINPESEAFAVTAKIFEDFYAEVLDHGAIPLIVMFPSGPEIVRQREGKPNKYGPFLEFFERKELRHVDLREVFAKRGSSYTTEELSGGHYTPLGNKLVAEYLSEYLGELELDSSLTRPQQGAKAAHLGTSRGI